MSEGFSIGQLIALLAGVAFIAGLFWIIARPPGLRRHQADESEDIAGVGARNRREDGDGWSGGHGGGGDGGGGD